MSSTGVAIPPGPNDRIIFPGVSPDNYPYFILYWNTGASVTNQGIADSSAGGLQRNQDLTGMRQNSYTPPARPDPTKNVWRGNPFHPTTIRWGSSETPELHGISVILGQQLIT